MHAERSVHGMQITRIDRLAIETKESENGAQGLNLMVGTDARA